MPILSVQHLTTQLRRAGQWNTVVNDVSFDIDANETVAVVGESGSGKSVTALSIMGLLPERVSKITGRVLLDGEDLLRFDEKRMQSLRGNKIGMIFQEPMTSLNPVLTVGRQIAETLIRHRGLSRRDAKTQTIQLLDRVRIPAASRRYDEFPHQLSGACCSAS
ncbi:ABC transporter ATP-binding protein [Devosia chinhatensis]|uniref:ABC transporter ATP-binding protein n=1 Tax=Devosia aurantiaca TaxID=2714858 RepID=A0A6M1SWX9_9HYPH|nr:ABC transporter ATP-binding protein [Devosia aurantiaca]